MDKFEKENADTAGLFAELMAGVECERRKMFGCSVAFLNGKMFAGVFADRLFFRLDANARAGLGDRAQELVVFEPVRGRAMKAYMELPGKRRNDTLFDDLLGLALECAKALPAKEKKPKGK